MTTTLAVIVIVPSNIIISLTYHEPQDSHRQYHKVTEAQTTSSGFFVLSVPIAGAANTVSCIIASTRAAWFLQYHQRTVTCAKLQQTEMGVDHTMLRS